MPQEAGLRGVAGLTLGSLLVLSMGSGVGGEGAGETVLETEAAAQAEAEQVLPTLAQQQQQHHHQQQPYLGVR